MTFGEWWQYTKIASIHFYRGITRLMVSVINGILSLLAALWRMMVRCISSYPNIALGTFLLVVVITWLLTFASMRARAVCAEDRLGVVSYEYQTFKERHGYE